MDKKFVRSRSVRYRSAARSRATQSVCLEKSKVDLQDADKNLPAMSNVVASEGGSLSSAGFISDMIDSDGSALDRLRAELQEACIERLKAAEYGLVLLDEKNFLQQEVDRLEVQHEESRQEVDNLNQQLQESRSESSYFKQQVSSLREDLVEQCDEREEELVKDSRNLLQQLSNVKHSLKSETEQRRLLEEEVEILRQNEHNLENKVIIAKRQSSEELEECRTLRMTNAELRQQLGITSQTADDENRRLRQENAELAEQVHALCEELDNIQAETLQLPNELEKQAVTAEDTSPAEEGSSSTTHDGLPSSSRSSQDAASPAGQDPLSETNSVAEDSRNGDCPRPALKRQVSGSVKQRLRQRTSVESSYGDYATEAAFEKRERELLQEASQLRADLVAARTEVDGIRQMSADTKLATSKQIARLQEELELMGQREQEAHQQSKDHEEQANSRQKMAVVNEDVLSHLSGELRALNMDLVKVSRVASSLGGDLTKRKLEKQESCLTESDILECDSNVQLLNNIRRQVRSVKSALDLVVMQSLQKAAAKIGQARQDADSNLCDERKESLQQDLRRAQDQLAAKTDESSQLRNVSLLKLMWKESALHLSSSCRWCDDFIGQLAQGKKEASALRDEAKLLDTMLNRAIEQKLALTEKLENYEFEAQRKSMVQASPGKSEAKKPTRQLVDSKSPLSARLRFLRRAKS
ncbi:protein bicaudal D-like [Sycon ciliatum]|uniref:protein bicaudal D-like n=1 Tax=Sycon ciliatum TaxID=27933 RepID=UPI0031F69E99